MSLKGVIFHHLQVLNYSQGILHALRAAVLVPRRPEEIGTSPHLTARGGHGGSDEQADGAPVPWAGPYGALPISMTEEASDTVMCLEHSRTHTTDHALGVAFSKSHARL